MTFIQSTTEASSRLGTRSGETFLSSVCGLPIMVLGGTEMLTVLDGTIVALVIPKISEEFRIAPTLTSWFITAYVLSFAGFLLLGGRIGDAFGRKKVFITGIMILILASLCTGFASTFSVFIACRIVQGLGAALAAPNAMAFVATLYQPGTMRSRAVAIYGSMMGLGSVIGLTVGGVLATIDWRWVFWINVPMGLAIIVGAVFTLPETTTEKVCFDLLGMILVTGGSAGIITGISLIDIVHYTSPAFYLPLIIGVIAVGLFIFNEFHSKNPLIPLSLVANKNRVLALLASFFAGAIMTCMAIYTAQYLQFIVEFTPQQSGFAVLPFAVGMGAAMVLSPIVSQKVPPRWVIISAGVLLLISFFYVRILIEHYPGYFPRFFLIIGVIGFGVGFVLTSILLSVLAGVAPADAGVLSALQKIIVEIGGGAGVLVIATIQNIKIKSLGGTFHSLENLNKTDRHILVTSYSFCILCIAIVAIITGFIVLFMKFTPQEVMAGMKAKEQAESGLL